MMSEGRPKGVVYVKELVFAPFKDTNLYDFLGVFVTQGTRRVLQDPTAIGSAMGEIFGGLAQGSRTARAASCAD